MAGENTTGKTIARVIIRIIILLMEIIFIPVSMGIGVAVDTNMADPTALGHPVPVFTVIFPLLAIVLLILTIIIMIVVSVVRHARRKSQ